MRQRVSVSFDYAVHFTRALFDPSNPVLVDCLAEREPERRHRLAVFVDAGVLAARPGLADEIAGYVKAHAARLELAAPPEKVPGGEAVKNADLWRQIDREQRRLRVAWPVAKGQIDDELRALGPALDAAMARLERS